MKITVIFIFSVFAMAQTGEDWKVKITNNAQFDLVVKGWKDEKGGDFNCWKFEDFERQKTVQQGKSLIFYSQCNNLLAKWPPCFGDSSKYIWIEIAEHPGLQGADHNHGYVSYLRLMRKYYEIDEGTSCSSKGQVENKCGKFKQIDPIQVEPIKDVCYERTASQWWDDEYRNLNIGMFKGKLDDDNSGDNCYYAVDVTVTKFE